MLEKILKIDLANIINGGFSIIILLFIKYGYNRMFMGRYIGEVKLDSGIVR